MKYICLTLFLLFLYPVSQFAQKDTLAKLSFTGDFRFRFEQDWNSYKSDGNLRKDRTRLRYRIRLGLKYQHNDWAAFGMRLRTGFMHHQQDPHLTIGTGFKEFGTMPIGFEKLFLSVKKNGSRLGQVKILFRLKNKMSYFGVIMFILKVSFQVQQSLLIPFFCNPLL